MSFTIYDVDGEELYTSETAESMKEAVEEAVEKDVSLERATLQGEDLRGTNLQGTNLRLANLESANLQRTNLYSADLYSANLQRTNLYSADLYSANLQFANLKRANLQGSNLELANLKSANLYRSQLDEASLQGAKGLQPEFFSPLHMLLDQLGKIYAYKLVDVDGQSPFAQTNGWRSFKYVIGQEYSVDEWNDDEYAECGAGISLATLDWCLYHRRLNNRILIAEFTADDIVAIPVTGDGKFRVKKCKIVGEKDLQELGISEQ